MFVQLRAPIWLARCAFDGRVGLRLRGLCELVRCLISKLFIVLEDRRRVPGQFCCALDTTRLGNKRGMLLSLEILLARRVVHNICSIVGPWMSVGSGVVTLSITAGLKTAV